jgi:hypothetical protein
MLARKRADVVGRKWKEALTELAGSPLDDGLTRALTARTALAIETRLPSGSHAYRAELSPLTDSQGLVVLLREGQR